MGLNANTNPRVWVSCILAKKKKIMEVNSSTHNLVLFKIQELEKTSKSTYQKIELAKSIVSNSSRCEHIENSQCRRSIYYIVIQPQCSFYYKRNKKISN